MCMLMQQELTSRSRKEPALTPLRLPKRVTRSEGRCDRPPLAFVPKLDLVPRPLA